MLLLCCDNIIIILYFRYVNINIGLFIKLHTCDTLGGDILLDGGDIIAILSVALGTVFNLKLKYQNKSVLFFLKILANIFSF